MTAAGRLRQVRRSTFRYYLRSHLAVIASVAVATATLTGALLVGDSMRGSLREQALAGLGPIRAALQAPRFFREVLADRISQGAEAGAGLTAAPIIQLPGAIQHVPTGLKVTKINVYGCDGRLRGLAPKAMVKVPSEGVIINEALAEQVRARVGDEISIFIERSQLVPLDTLLGRRDEVGASIRLKVEGIGLGGGLDDLALRPSVRTARNAFVSLEALQKAIRKSGRVNAVLVGGAVAEEAPAVSEADSQQAQALLRKSITAADLDWRIRADAANGCAVIESDRLLLEPSLEQGVLRSAKALGAPATCVLSYLVNTIEVERASNERAGPRVSLPYSTAVAIDGVAGLTLRGGEPAKEPGPEDVLLNEWAADELGAKVGDRIRISYYVSRPMGRLETLEASFTLRGIVRLAGLGADPGLTPTYEGITNTKRITDWNPPFPMDMKLIRPKDEAYWDQYRATPKLFVGREAGLRLWSEPDGRFGRFTSIRVSAPAKEDVAGFAKRIEQAILEGIQPEGFGLAFRPVRAAAIAAASGSTDFGMLFVGFSSFLIIAAAMLVALLFRLGMERRASQIGLLLALGWTPRLVRRLLLRESIGVAALGVLLGVAASLLYGWLMICGLRSWWSEAVTIPHLGFHVSAWSLHAGLIASMGIALFSMALSVRSLAKIEPRKLLSGDVAAKGSFSPGRTRGSLALALVLAALAGAATALPRFAESVPEAAAFFMAGVLFLGAAFSGLVALMNARSRRSFRSGGRAALASLGLRNAARHRGRSLMTSGLVASATFVIVAVGANRLGVPKDALDRNGGTGGFRLIGESAVPIPYDLNRREGREALGLGKKAAGALAEARVTSLRLRAGDDTSCLNLYQTREPRILGVPPELITRGAFSFSAALPGSAEEAKNPWLLLQRTISEGVVPCIGDANTVQWLLHKGLGQDIELSNERGEPLRLRVVAMLSGSILQGELLVSEANFVRQFPSIAGYRVFLFDVSQEGIGELEGPFKREMTDRGLEIESTRRRLAEFLAIENTYLSAFQTLGGLGVILGTLGLAAVMLRNLLERRGELALLAALGYRFEAIRWLVLCENAALLVFGLMAGVGSALVAIAPHLLSRVARVPWGTLGLTLGAVLVVGMAGILAALASALRTPLLASLRRE